LSLTIRLCFFVLNNSEKRIALVHAHVNVVLYRGGYEQLPVDQRLSYYIVIYIITFPLVY